MTNNFSRRQIIKAAGGFVAGASSVGGFSAISSLILNSTMSEPAQAADLSPATNLTGGAIVTLTCLGRGVRNFVYLNGQTYGNGIVNMTNSLRNPPFSGTRWYAFTINVPNSPRYWYQFYNNGSERGGPRYLNGITREGDVNLVDSPLSGTVWAVFYDRSFSPYRYYLYCVGETGAGNSRWLNGVTRNGAVNLVTETEREVPALSGTAWSIST
jgi:hypothetical protein